MFGLLKGGGYVFFVFNILIFRVGLSFLKLDMVGRSFLLVLFFDFIRLRSKGAIVFVGFYFLVGGEGWRKRFGF